MEYPYYIAEWRVGRIGVDEIPLQHRLIPSIRRMYESGQIGGRRLLRKENSDVAALIQDLRREGQSPRDVEFYIVRAPNRQMERVQFWQIERDLKKPRTGV